MPKETVLARKSRKRGLLQLLMSKNVKWNICRNWGLAFQYPNSILLICSMYKQQKYGTETNLRENFDLLFENTCRATLTRSYSALMKWAVSSFDTVKPLKVSTSKSSFSLSSHIILLLSVGSFKRRAKNVCETISDGQVSPS